MKKEIVKYLIRLTFFDNFICNNSQLYLRMILMNFERKISIDFLIYGFTTHILTFFQFNGKFLILPLVTNLFKYFLFLQLNKRVHSKLEIKRQSIWLMLLISITKNKFYQLMQKLPLFKFFKRKFN